MYAFIYMCVCLSIAMVYIRLYVEFLSVLCFFTTSFFLSFFQIVLCACDCSCTAICTCAYLIKTTDLSYTSSHAYKPTIVASAEPWHMCSENGLSSSMLLSFVSNECAALPEVHTVTNGLVLELIRFKD